MDRSLSPHSADWTLSFFAFPWGLRNCGKLTKAWPRSLNFDPWGPIPSTTSYDRGGTPALRSRAIPADGTAVFTEAGQEPRVSAVLGHRRCTLHRCADPRDVTERQGPRESLEQNRPFLVLLMLGTDLRLGTAGPSGTCVLPDKLPPARSAPPHREAAGP